jgi:4-hydroxy-tetrahydrodipicolinate synthase
MALGGVFAAALTPFDRRSRPHHARYIAHCSALLANGCDGINVLGTTGEANSIGIADRWDLMETIASSDLPLDRMMVGTGTPSLNDSARLTRHAQACGFAGALILPPFYYKSVSDDGLFAYFARLIERVDPRRIRLYLYNFPAMTGIPYTVPLVQRLAREFPGIVVGLKDSANDPAYERELIASVPGFAVFPGSEGYIADAKRFGAAGCISATVNVTSREAQAAWSASDADAAELQSRIEWLRKTISAQPVIAAVKAIKAHVAREEAWERILPPLVPLGVSQRESLFASLKDWLSVATPA